MKIVLQFGPKYPVLEGLEKYRRAARVAPLSRAEMQEYGEAVGQAIRKLQKTELGRACTPTPSLKQPPIPPPPSSARLTKYSVPNPFIMVGDPKDRSERSLYEHAMKQKRARSALDFPHPSFKF
jgi:hypothetical protein